MFKHTLTSLLRRAALALLFAAGGHASAGTVHVEIDTAGFGAASGHIDMQLSASGGVPLATAQVSNMAGFGGGGFNDVFGVSYGNGIYTFRNDTLNDVFLATDFGGVLSFDLTFAGQHDPLTSYVSHFLVSAFDEGDAPLGSYDPVTFALADFSWTPAPTAGAEGGIGIGLADPGAVTAVPEPADWLLMATGLAAMALVARRRRATM